MTTRPVLATPRTSLRPLGDADLDAMHALWTDALVRRYLFDDVVIDRRRAADVIEASDADFAAHGYGLWLVTTGDSPRPAGCCGLRTTEEGPAEIIYSFWPPYWGRGLATEAARAVLEHAFHTLHLPLVEGATDVPNTASVRVMERIGMSFVRRGLLNGLDTLFYRLTRESYDARRSSQGAKGPEVRRSEGARVPE